MGFFLDMLTEKRDTMGDAINRFLTGDDLYPTMTASGVAVNETTALTVTAVYAAVKIIAGTLASLPITTYAHLDPRGKTKAYDHPVYSMLHDSPNPEMTAFDWCHITSIHKNLWGAGISEIEFDNSGRPIALWPLPPWRVEPKRLKDRSAYYEVSFDNGDKKRLAPFQVCVFKAPTTSTYKWMSPISTHRETIGYALAIGEFGAKTFGQGTAPAGILTHPGKLGETSEKTLRENMKNYSGLSGAHRLMFLEEGMKFERIGLPPEDAQYLESRKHTISDIARIYNVPLHLLQDHEKSTSWGSGIEEMNSGFLTYTLLPDMVQMEQELNRRLLGDDRQHFVKFITSALLRGKLSERAEAYAKLFSLGSLSPNDIRELEDRNPIEGGDIYMVPMNYQSVEFAGEKPVKSPSREMT